MWKPAMTGTNDIPLGNKRRFGPAVIEDAPRPHLVEPSPSAYPRTSSSGYDSKRERDYDSAPSNSTATADTPADPNTPRKRKSRWGEAKAELPGLPTAISSAGVSQAELDNYAIQLRLEEINRKLRLNDYIPPDRERSPSPPPTYDAHGRRTNTRDVRYRRRLEDERIKLVDKALKGDPNFRPPAEYHQQKRSHRPQDKVYIPVKEFPEINFFGLLVGPRGNSLKKMERESGAKISIRGKGSVKEGKGRPDAFADDSEEDLHCLVMAETDEKVALCVKLINKVIETAASTPEGQNDHKRNQLRELAALNGTLRDDENQVCQNCGGVGHRKYDCPEQRNFTANIICRICGSAGHMARDCTVKKDPNGFLGSSSPPGSASGGLGMGMGMGAMSGGGKAFDSEYASLMAELGEGGDSGGKGWGGRGDGGGMGDSGLGMGLGGSGGIPPWRRPDVWQQQQAPPQNNPGGYRPPQAMGGYGGAPYPGAPAAGYAGGSGYGPNGQWVGYPQAGASGYGTQQAGGYDPAAYAQYYQGLYQQQQTAAPQ